MECPFCHATNLAGAEVCEGCGQAITRFGPDEVAGRHVRSPLRRVRLGEARMLEPIVMGPRDSVGEAVRRMRDRHLGSVFVVEDDRLTGIFTEADTWVAYLVLAGYSLGLPATTWSRLLQNAFFALKDTKTPARMAVVRVSLSAGCGVPLMLWLDRYSLTSVLGPGFGEGGENLYLGAVGLALASAVGAWAELTALRRSLLRRLPGLGVPLAPLGRMVILALAATVPAVSLWWLVRHLQIVWVGMAVVGLYAAVYLAAAYAFRMPEVSSWVGRLRREN